MQYGDVSFFFIYVIKTFSLFLKLALTFNNVKSIYKLNKTHSVFNVLKSDKNLESAAPPPQLVLLGLHHKPL